jgi:hypothetical protein
LGNVSYLQPFDPKFNDSPAPVIIDKMVADNTDGHQLWVTETGWFYKHMDFTYWYLKSGIHPVRAYYGYFMKTALDQFITIGNVTYSTSDYIVDTRYLENGQQNIPEVTFKLNNISVYKPEHILPLAFVVRKDVLVPAKLEKFTSDEIIISGQFLPNDVAVLKTAFYPGWKMNGKETENIVNMVGAQITTNTDTITFRYDPSDVKIGGLLSGIGIILLGFVIYKRREINTYLTSISKIQEVPENKSKSKKKK